ncbi:hypothetical protein [Nocardia pseudobrasiliensis]|uniref:Uncharacterized protein n=1 Tax=Nocardia pseudobrasiliensis TaxID=45979 RepID=A0A370I5T5_9NOCA|nr:hypothetical protein [Nocardia pseudobrasiliensis]RDI65990.1 hypothetical protein DFR76_105309 [Nocardia pseudobrasiliensis]
MGCAQKVYKPADTDIEIDIPQRRYRVLAEILPFHPLAANDAEG